MFFYAAVGAVLGHDEWLDGQTLVIAGVVALSAAVLVLPAIRILGWTEGEPLGLRLPVTTARAGAASAPGGAGADARPPDSVDDRSPTSQP